MNLEALNKLDRRWIFLAMFLAVSIPILTQASFPEKPTVLSQGLFDRVEAMPSGSRVLMAFDYDANSAAELRPMATAFVRHCALKRHKMYFTTTWPTGLPMIEHSINSILKKEFADAGLKYGEDYVNLGYFVGENVAIRQLASDMKGARENKDAAGMSLDELPMMRDVTNVSDMALVLNVSAGFPGAKEWVQYACSPNRIPIAAGCTGVQAPMLYPYFPNQLCGLLAAIKGAAEYEAALATKYTQYAKNGRADVTLNEGIRRMGPQLWAHRLIIGLIVLGNIIHFAGRRWGTAR